MDGSKELDDQIVKLLEVCKDIQFNALDWDGGEYVDIRKQDFDEMSTCLLRIKILSGVQNE